MYLKALDLFGFKSFAKPTRLDFEPGMIAVVGPNGCGKSNVLDAMRWVLGEQSARVLRGTKMEDCIFNGTDNFKPLGMAEVSLTFADCEQVLGTEYNEVTVTRRVYRSGEGEYFMNKTPCRLKDIQRLFMNTGIGTSSYSIMEQGRIDQILSSHPEDRREIFEEASGITRFKSDRADALRKLDQTEANLLRLTDVLQEVKRQIGSLERQAGKARRFKAARDEIRTLDIYVTRQRLCAADADLDALRSQLTSIAAKFEAAHADVIEMEANNSAIRRQLADSEVEIESLMEARNNASSQLERARDEIKLNTERIRESQRASEQDKEEIARASALLEKQRITFEQLSANLDKAKKDHLASEKVQREKVMELANHETATEDLRKKVEALQAQVVELESNHATLQNDLIRLDASDRSDAVRRERLYAEKSGLEKEIETYREALAGIEESVGGMDARISARTAEMDNLATQHLRKQKESSELQTSIASLQAQAAGRRAEVELIERSMRETSGFPAGARLLLDESNPLGLAREAVLEPLASGLTAEKDFRVPLEAVLRSWLDAVVVKDAKSAVAVLASLTDARKGSIRMLVADNCPPVPAVLPEAVQGVRLLEHVRCSAALRQVTNRLLGNVFVVESLNAVPLPLPADAVYVTYAGAVLSGSGAAEFWMAESEQVNPLTSRRLADEARESLVALETELTANRTALSTMNALLTTVAGALEQAHEEIELCRQERASKRGELEVISRQAAQMREKFETVSFEIASIEKQYGPTGGRRHEISSRMNDVMERRGRLRSEVETASRQVQAMDRARASVSAEASEARIRCSELAQKNSLLEDQVALATSRLGEIQETLASRTSSLAVRSAALDDLTRMISEAQGRMAALEEEARDTSARLETTRKNRQNAEAELTRSDAQLSERRSLCDELRDGKSQLDIKLAEGAMRRQNTIDRVTGEYGMRLEELMKEPDPVWESERPETEWIDARVAELRAKLDAMGPVNQEAIQEHQELQDRFAFLTKQHDDLVDARQKLVNMISKINQTTSEMFAKTFAEVNINFDTMFKKLFNGGSAKLVLVNEEDILESGIEIIARPPGKKLQSVSLLSGGERTLTAVSLLFAIYMIKPSPFCFLDELDAPLDDSNIVRFINILKGFLDRSQFLVITHSQQTVAAADTIYGVTMEEKGVSKVISMKFENGRPTPATKSEPVKPSIPKPPAPAEPPVQPQAEHQAESSAEPEEPTSAPVQVP